MNIVCSKEILLEKLNIASKAISTKIILPILECFLLSADDDGFKIIANDLEMGIEVNNIKAEIIEEGIVALEARLFMEIVRKLPDGEINIYTEDNNITHIKCNKAEFKILGLSGEEFPFLPKIEKSMEYRIGSINFKNMIRQTIFSVAIDESKPALTGELLEIKDGDLNIVAVDGFRVSYKKTNLSKDVLDISVIVPAKTLSEISKILPNNETIILVYFTDKHVLFEFDDCIVVSRLLDGEFIKYEQIFTEDYTTKIMLNRQNIVMALERASLISKEAKKNPVKLKIEPDILVITSNTEMGTSYDELPIEMDGSPLEIAFNPKYLLDALKALEEDNVKMQFTSPLSPCIIKDLSSDLSKYLVLPLRLKG